MDAIYHFAQITLVATAGSDANAGLPGFGVHSWPAATHNSTREPDELYREWYKPNFRTVIPASTWSNRGWTLQEQLLSKRCLFITKHQIYFQCRCSTIEEEYGLCFEVGNDTRITDVPSFTNLLYNFWLDNQTRMQAAVTAFTSRQLTHSADVLNAFAGITNALNFLASRGHSASSIKSNAPVHFTSEYALPHTLCF
jgi:Heterokaryon incompatibility protein (HET)